MSGNGTLPPLNALIAFEAASRLGGFSRAGIELGLTQSAVSRQILKLEAYLGTKLFLRTATGASLTPAGEIYAVDVQRLLADLAGATGALKRWSGPHQVTFACSHSIADMWLAERLVPLQAALPELELRLRVADVSHLRPDEYDLALHYRRELPSDVVAQALGPEEIVPVAAPGYPPLVPRHLDNGPHAGQGITLIGDEDPLREWLDWPHWLAAAGMAWPPGARRWRLGSYRLAIEAVAGGGGIALGWRWLLRGQLESGRLVPAHDFELKTDGKFYLMRPRDRHARRIVRQVMDWLVESDRS